MRLILGLDAGPGDFMDPARGREFERAAAIELARELNKGTVVAFVGSGVTVAYGRPLWSALVGSVLKETQAEIAMARKPGPNRLWDALRVADRDELTMLEESLAHIKDGVWSNSAIQAPDRYLYTMELCERVFELLGRPREIYRLLDRMFAEARAEDDHSKQVDPLRRLAGALGLQRFLTTNYDREIETDFERRSRDYGLRDRYEVGTAAAHDVPRTGFVSATAENLNASDLVLFATRSAETPAGVFHLHGRANRRGTLKKEDPPSPWLIVTERDYQRLYVRRGDPNARLYREALDLAFAANTVLFVGLGMGEEDILRPLREFVAEQPRRHDRSLFAIIETPIPSIWEKKECDWSEQARATREQELDFVKRELRHVLWVRYGVRTIFYGTLESTRTRLRLRKLLGELKAMNGVWLPAEKLTQLAKVNPQADPTTPSGALELLLKKQGLAPEQGRITLTPVGIEHARRLVTLAQTKELCDRLDGLQEQRLAWWKDWLWLPPAREVGFHHDDRPGLEIVQRHHFSVKTPAFIEEVGRRSAEKLAKSVAARPGRPRLLLVTARRGAGRGSFGHRLKMQDGVGRELVEAMLGRGSPGGRLRMFFATTHFTSEFLSVIDALIDFLKGGPPDATKLTRRERLGDGLCSLGRQWKTRHVVVLSGVERLINQHGELLNPELEHLMRELVRAVTGRKGVPNLALVLLGREGPWNEDFLAKLLPEDAGLTPAAAMLPLDREGASALWEPLKNGLEAQLAKEEQKSYLSGSDRPEDFRRLSDLVAQHRYALILAATAAARLPREGDRSLFELVIRDLERRAPHRQAEKTVDFVLRHVRRHGLRLEGLDAELTAIGSALDWTEVYEALSKSDNPWRDAASRAKEMSNGASDRNALAKAPHREALQRELLIATGEALIQRTIHFLALCPSPMEVETLFRLVFERDSQDLPAAFVGDSPNRKPLAEAANLAAASRKGTWPHLWMTIVDLLVRLHLVYSFEPRTSYAGEGGWAERLTVHSLVRRLVRRRLGHDVTPFAESGYFELSSYDTSGVTLPSLGPSTYRHLVGMVDRLIDADDPAIGYRQREARLRSALHVVRASLPLVQVLRCESLGCNPTRWGDELGQLDLHRNRMIRLLDGVRALAKKLERGALYADELIWLYNEFAVICQGQGDLVEARSLFEQILALDAQGNRPDEGSYGWGQATLHQGIVAIERGDPDHALKRLQRVIEVFSKDDPRLGARANGYLGVLDHLRGEDRQAAERYRAAIEVFADRHNLRALAGFLRRQGDLHRSLGEHEEAKAAYARSIAVAATHPDLLHYARIAEARLELTQKPSKRHPERAIRQLEAATRYARAIGLPRMQAEAYRVWAEIRLEQGEFDAAEEVLREANGIFARRDMRLRTISAQVLLGRILSRRGDEANARRLLQACRKQASVTAYVIKEREAGDLLESLRPLDQPVGIA